MAPLLPKLRGHFAEFLNNASSVGLRILSSSTCVGLRYGYVINDSGFSRRMACALPYFLSVRFTPSLCCTDLPLQLVLRLHAAFHSAPALSTRVPTVLLLRSTGISTCCPSTTAFPTYPGQISFTLETLDIRPRGFPPLSRYSFRHSLFHTVHSPFQFCFFPYAMLLYRCFHPAASVSCFSPGHFRRRTSRLVSYYALFQCMAASEPTS